MAGNSGLRNANSAKKDEFYTQLVDIENELRHYKRHFVGKVVLCNCDDPYESNFFKYFALNFRALGLKKLICTCYATSPVVGQQLSLFDVETVEFQVEDGKKPYKIEITEVEDTNGDGAINLADVTYLIKNKKNTLSLLEGDGDFRSAECIALLKEADVVVTNPPFSLFREYVAQLMEYEKKFIIIGNQNAMTYREIFPLLRDNKMWLGFGFKGGAAHFINKHYVDYATAGDHKEGMIRVSGVVWYTNLDITKRHEGLDLYRKYKGHEDEFPTYANFDAINVDVTKEIPEDYEGMIGVPITFMDKYNPDQFEIIGLGISNSGIEIGVRPYTPEHKKYRKEVQKRGAVDGDLYMMIDGVVTVPYARVIIKNKHPKVRR